MAPEAARQAGSVALEGVPLGLTAPFLILVGVTASLAIRPLLGDAKNVALAEDFAGAVIILGVFAVMTLWFRRLQSGSLY